jgi:hypothetical protein
VDDTGLPDHRSGHERVGLPQLGLVREERAQLQSFVVDTRGGGRAFGRAPPMAMLFVKCSDLLALKMKSARSPHDSGRFFYW